MRRYYIQATSDGGFGVQVVEGGTEDFSSYHRTHEEAVAAMAEEYVRDAAPALHFALTLGVEMRAAQKRYFKDRTSENLLASKGAEAAFDKAAHDALRAASGAAPAPTQGGLL